MTRLKDATFESNALTGTDAFTTTTGSPTIDGTSKIKGTYCFRTNWASATNMNGTYSGISEPEIWFTFFIYSAALPTSGAPRVVTISNGNTQFNLTLNSSGVITARNNTTNLSSIGTISINTLYRVGVHLKVSTGAANADAVIECYFATGNNAFGAAALSLTNQVMNIANSNFSSIQVGMSNGVATTADVFWDNLRVDNVSMPSESTDTAMTVSKTVTDTISKAANVAYIKSITVTDTVAKAVNVAYIKSITVTDTITATTVKAYLRAISISVITSSVIIRDILRLIAVSTTSTVSITRDIKKILTKTVSSLVDTFRAFSQGKEISLAVSSTPTIQKGIAKVIGYSSGVIITIQRLLTLSVEYSINSPVILTVNKSIEMIKEVIVNSAIAFSKQLANTFTNTFFHRNTRRITITIKNTALNIIGKNTRNIDV